jgi:hypothetical protein
LADLLRLEARAKSADPSKKTKAKSVIMVWLAGGPATIDMWDLKPGAPTGGEFKQIDTAAAGVKISEHLPKMAKVMDKATVVRSLAHTIPSHGPATVFMTTGNKPTPTSQYPAMGSLVTKLLPSDPGVPPYVTFGEVRGAQQVPRDTLAPLTTRSSSKATRAWASVARLRLFGFEAFSCRPALP